MISRAKEKVSDRGVENVEIIAQEVAVGAIKYMVLKQGLGRNIVFDKEKSLSFEGDSGPYVQYTLTRARSVLEKALSEKITAVVRINGNPTVLERMIDRFTEKIVEALENREPSVVTQYLVALSSEFNAWYAQQKIVDVQNPESSHNVAVTRAVMAVLSRGLYMLGIPTPLKM
jgi:arginyl-tRNA synthetase